MICFGCSKPGVIIPPDACDHSGSSGKPDEPGYPPPGHPSISDPDIAVPVNKYRLSIVRTAVTALGTPYRWGGLSPKGFDCSGLVVYSYAQIGIHVPRTARNQFKSCSSVSREKIQPGDLVFFSVPRRRGVVHVGIYIGEGQFVHAPGKGRKVKRVSINNVYFKRHFIKAGHFFKEDAG